MDEVSIIKELAKDPITFVAGAIFLHTLTQLVRTIKEKGSTNDTVTGQTERIAALHTALRECIKSITEIGKTVSVISATQEDVYATRRLTIEKLEKLTSLANNLFDLHKDPNSQFATGRIEESSDEIIRMLNEIKITLAGMR